MNDSTQPSRPAVVVGHGALTIEDVCDVADGARALRVSEDVLARAAHARSLFEERVARNADIYGVSTGVGASVKNAIVGPARAALAKNLRTFHGCGVGQVLGEAESAATVVARLGSLSQGMSSVRPALLTRLADMVSARVLPVIPSLGSVGASGDLTPLSYVAAALAGEREVYDDGQRVPTAAALRARGWAPLTLGPRETLALMNGTSVMTGLACLAHRRARRLADVAALITALSAWAMRSNPGHFDRRIFAAKPHPGTCAAGAQIAALYPTPRAAPDTLQARYSIRCAPHVIGVLNDALAASRGPIETELNGANDNPLLDPDTGDILHGGNFYGGHIAFAMDGLKAAVASVADLIDRQLASLCDPHMSGGLPDNLRRTDMAAAEAHHGLKAVSISASALTAEALKLTMPAASFSRSTECHNQDKVPMGTIAARDCLRVLELSEYVGAMGVLAGVQAASIVGTEGMSEAARACLARCEEIAAPVEADRALDGDLTRLALGLRDGLLDDVLGAL